ncbi:MAG: hypothetical protein MHPSP_000303 [Paramarteilia canceri]
MQEDPGQRQIFDVSEPEVTPNFENFDNKQLRLLCQKVLGENIGPITPKTKQIYIKKLRNKLNLGQKVDTVRNFTEKP